MYTTVAIGTWMLVCSCKKEETKNFNEMVGCREEEGWAGLMSFHFVCGFMVRKFLGGI